MRKKFAIRLGWITLVTILLVVIAGSVVRMTGSGMGCPDWPKCFGCLIPPTSVDELPDNYKEIYSAKREKKLKRFAGFLTALGLENKAKELLADKSLLEEQDFNVFHTYTEYINRLVGALAGLLILIQTILVTFKFRKRVRLIIAAWLLLILTLFQAWFGAMVVATNIVPWVLSVHMIIAVIMIIIQVIIISGYQSKSALQLDRYYYWLLFVGLVLLIIQIISGTQIRQEVDVLVKTVPRGQIVESLSMVYVFHRTLALLFIALAILTFIKYRKQEKLVFHLLVGLILVEAMVGKLFSLTGFVKYLQPMHLLLSMLMIITLSYILLNYAVKKT